MREIRLYGSEGGGAARSPYPYHSFGHNECIVVMLDHWHAVLATCDGMTLSKRMKILDQWISRQTDEFLQQNWEAMSHSIADFPGWRAALNFGLAGNKGSMRQRFSPQNNSFLCVPMLRRIR